MARDDVLITVEALAGLDEVDLLDVRWRLGDADGDARDHHPQALAQHLEVAPHAGGQGLGLGRCGGLRHSGSLDALGARGVQPHILRQLPAQIHSGHRSYLAEITGLG